jgi:hypothetical protein
MRLPECAFASPSHTQPVGVDLVISESRNCYRRPAWLNDGLRIAVTRRMTSLSAADAGDAATTRKRVSVADAEVSDERDRVAVGVGDGG